jgi:BirA family transcriptional regulator, biotin operon repressor / biotin---[acetyl-CoA-carboxylase] ligase
MSWRIIKLETTDSTQTYVKGVDGDRVVVQADYQATGHGQGKNKWESERGKNLLFSVKTKVPAIPANRQFLLSMAGALALRDVLEGYADGFNLKWPNDIYWKDSKISGTIIDTTVAGKVISQCIYGIGINVNQLTFASDAPNPVSLCNIIGRETDRDRILNGFLSQLDKRLEDLADRRYEETVAEYKGKLYRRTGFYEYEDANGRFIAEIKDVLPNGHLVLCDSVGMTRDYELKEVKFII